MRFRAVASFISAACLVAIIPVNRVARAEPQGGSTPPAQPTLSGDAGAAGGTALTGAPATGVATPAPGPAAASVGVTKSPSSLPDSVAPRAGEGGTPPPPRRMVASLSHDLQFGLALMIGDGYRGIFPYQTNIYCGDAKDPMARVCTNRAPAFVDVQPSFGLSNAWDFLVDVRYGLGKDFNRNHQFFVMPGFRYWLDPQSRVKFFTTLQLAYDRSMQNSSLVGDNDLGFRNANGLMFEVMRNLGVYAQFGETVGFVRWLSFLVDAGIGVQARVP